MKYTINYCNGIEDTINGTLADAMQAADTGAAYTQCDIVITDDTDREITRRRWWGVAYDPTEASEDAPITFGNYGYYSDWT